MIDRAQQQNTVGRVLGDRNLNFEIGVVVAQRGLNGFGRLGSRKSREHHFSRQRQ